MLEVALFAAPYLLVVGLLLVGRFPGERAIVARRGRPTGRLRAPRRQWLPGTEHPLVSLLERTSRRRRGPPAFA